MPFRIHSFIVPSVWRQFLYELNENDPITSVNWLIELCDLTVCHCYPRTHFLIKSIFQKKIWIFFFLKWYEEVQVLKNVVCWNSFWWLWSNFEQMNFNRWGVIQKCEILTIKVWFNLWFFVTWEMCHLDPKISHYTSIR